MYNKNWKYKITCLFNYLIFLKRHHLFYTAQYISKTLIHFSFICNNNNNNKAKKHAVITFYASNICIMNRERDTYKLFPCPPSFSFRNLLLTVRFSCSAVLSPCRDQNRYQGFSNPQKNFEIYTHNSPASSMPITPPRSSPTC